MLSATNTMQCKLLTYLCFCTLSAYFHILYYLVVSNFQFTSHHPLTWDPKHIARLLYHLLSPTVPLDTWNILPAEIPSMTSAAVPCPLALAPYQEYVWFKLCHCTGVCVYVYINYPFLTLKVKVKDNVLLYNSLPYRIQCFWGQIQKCLWEKKIQVCRLG